MENGGLSHLLARVFAVPSYAGSKVDTARAVSQVPGQPSVDAVVAPLHTILSQCYDEHDGTPQEHLLVLFAPIIPGTQSENHLQSFF